MQEWEHCKLVDGTVTYLGARGLLADKRDRHLSEAKAWDELEKEGWELVAVVIDPEEKFNYFFKRPKPAETR